MPKSYLSQEPGALRALRLDFDPYTQVKARLRALAACGHPTSKVEVIILGGTWTALPRRYQTWYVRRVLMALNDGLHGPKPRTSASLESLQLENETTTHRLVGLTIETRPDWLSAVEIQRHMRLGVTRVELGVQTLDDAVQQITRRGHTRADTARALQLLKDAGLKVGIHMMPGLPGATPAGDREQLRAVCTDEDMCPDQMKVYPCVVTPHSELATWWHRGDYTPYDTDTLTTILRDLYTYVPEYMRLVRIVRDIPGTQILAGSQVTNLRQLMENAGIISRDIRARELGSRALPPQAVLTLMQRAYRASGGEEIFMSIEECTSDTLVAFARVRLQQDGRIAYLRELHTYGTEVAVGSAHTLSGQHRGHGKKLLTAAESLARERGYTCMRIPSGIGVREYYRKCGYMLRGVYMEKDL